MKKRIKISEGTLVEWKYEGSDLPYFCTTQEWKVQMLKEKLFFEYKVPEELLNDFVEAIHDKNDEMFNGD